jgi:hypothetical protein
VLTMLYQLFQTLSSYIASQNKLTELAKRRAHLPPAQLKAEADLLQLDAQTLKANLLTLQSKINAAHHILKQQQQQQQHQSNNNNIQNNKQVYNKTELFLE